MSELPRAKARGVFWTTHYWNESLCPHRFRYSDAIPLQLERWSVLAQLTVKADFGPVSGDTRVRILEGELGTMRDRLAKLEAIYSEKLKIRES